MEINANEIKISAYSGTEIIMSDKLKITNMVVDKNQQLYDWWKAMNKDKMLPNQENYNKMIKGIWDKENPMINKKEGNEMIESLNLVDLYFREKREKIYKESNDKVSNIRNNNEIIIKVKKIIENAEKELNDLYLSQLDDEDLEKIKNGKKIENDKYPFIRDYEIELSYDGCYVNYVFENEKIKEIKEANEKKLNELNALEKTVKAHIGIAKTKEEVEEILTRYGILDKKGKLVCE